MANPIADQVIDFYSDLFAHLFSERFRPLISDRLKRKAVERQVEESSDAASQSLSRFLFNQQVSEEQAVTLLTGLSPLYGLLDLERISNPNLTPESLVEDLLDHVPVPERVREVGQEPVYRVALHSILQVLMLVGPVMAEWRKLGFASTFELPRRVVNRLNEISEQLDALGLAGESVADERYELTYRDYLLQRFHRVEAGTVRMTTSLNVDLRELFVMPRLKERPFLESKGEHPESAAIVDFMGLAEARKLFTSRAANTEDETPSALDQVRRCPRLVIVGVPGSGKSTFLEWLQLKIASVEEELAFAGQQAIPLLLRVRQLDPKNLPRGAGLIERATASRDRATLMPAGWLERQMEKGRVLLILDGLDETEPALRDCFILPWLSELCERYPDCHYLISSRPVGYPPGALRSLGFSEADLMDFGEPEIAEYTCHWCTAIRLAQNEPEAEARSEGKAEGKGIVQSFQSHPYISNLARNPLMLSAICLVNYFERGKLPEDRAVLYRLCVEGLLHHWDQRRGIQSEFTLEEKLRACRELALAMQADDRAEYPVEQVRAVFAKALGDTARAEALLEHVRFRTGLLLERRAGIFAFAHLTFQEYLAARAIHEGNHIGIDVERLLQERRDARWKEVIALYCGLVPAPAARVLLEHLIAQENSHDLAGVLAEAYLSAGPELARDAGIRKKLLEKIAVSSVHVNLLQRFSEEEVKPIANALLGKGKHWGSGAFMSLLSRPSMIEWERLLNRLVYWKELGAVELGEVVYLSHNLGSEDCFVYLCREPDIYLAPGAASALSQAEMALWALGTRLNFPRIPEFDTCLLAILQVLERDGMCSDVDMMALNAGWLEYKPLDSLLWPKFATSARRVAQTKLVSGNYRTLSLRNTLTSWADALEHPNKPEKMQVD